jgi:hypothetical protein
MRAAATSPEAPATATKGTSGYTQRGNCAGRPVIKEKYSSGNAQKIHIPARRVERPYTPNAAASSNSGHPGPNRPRIIV